MAETEDHRDLMIDLIWTLKAYPPIARRFYISGNLLLYYERGNKRRHVSPDLFAVRGLSQHRRRYYLLWEEGKSPEAVVEPTSKSTRKEDLVTKFELYRDTLKVKEYFLFDPHQEYLRPPLQGFRLVRGEFVPIKPVNGRLPSKVLGLHLEAQRGVLRFWDPATGKLLPTPKELQERAETAQREEAAARQRAEAAQRAEALARHRAEATQQEEAAARQRAEAELVRLRQELETLRRRLERGP
jgi:Uma2 family endonuclease